MRLPYAPSSLPPGLHNDFLSRILKTRGSHGLSPLDLTLLHSPPFYKGFMQFFGAIRSQSTLPADVMELAMCRVGAINGAAFEWMHHMPLLRKAGVCEEGVETVRTIVVGYVPSDLEREIGEGEKGLSWRLWKVLRFVDCMTRDVKVPEGVFEAVRGLLDERQVVELAVTTAGYNAVSRFLIVMDVAEMKDVRVGDAKLPVAKL